MLTSVLRTLIKNPVTESFYGKKKTINILTAFFIFHKSDVKIFLIDCFTQGLLKVAFCHLFANWYTNLKS